MCKLAKCYKNTRRYFEVIINNVSALVNYCPIILVNSTHKQYFYKSSIAMFLYFEV